MKQETGPFEVIICHLVARNLLFFITVLCHWEFESLSPVKTSCNKAVHVGCFSVSIIRRTVTLATGSLRFECDLFACEHTGSWFIMSSEGLLWGIGFTQNFDSGETDRPQ